MATKDRISPRLTKVDSTATKPRWRPRISVLNLLLLTTIVCLAVGLWRVGRTIGPLEQEVRVLRQLTGELDIEDPRKVHAIKLAGVEDLTWRWRVYIPQGLSVSFKTEYTHIPSDGAISSSSSSRRLADGGYIITCAFRRDRERDWQFIVHTPYGQSASSIPDEYVAWLERAQSGYSETGVGIHTETMKTGGKLELLRLRPAIQDGDGISSSQSDQPTNELLLRLETATASGVN